MALRVKLICPGVEPFEIPANPYPMYPYAERLNHVAVDSATGHRHVFDNGPTRIVATIEWKSIAYDVVKQYEIFLLEHAKMGLVPFKIICPTYLDLGNGMGKEIPEAYYAGSASLKDIIKPLAAGLYYDIELPYIFVRGYAQG